MEQHRLRGERPQAFYALSARADRQPVYRAARFCADRRADEPGTAARPGLRALPAISRGVEGGDDRRARPWRCPLHTAALVASRRVARALQSARELLVARR